MDFPHLLQFSRQTQWKGGKKLPNFELPKLIVIQSDNANCFVCVLILKFVIRTIVCCHGTILVVVKSSSIWLLTNS